MVGRSEFGIENKYPAPFITILYALRRARVSSRTELESARNEMSRANAIAQKKLEAGRARSHRRGGMGLSASYRPLLRCLQFNATVALIYILKS
jgi:hypothetical protein